MTRVLYNIALVHPALSRDLHKAVSPSNTLVIGFIIGRDLLNRLYHLKPTQYAHEILRYLAILPSLLAYGGMQDTKLVWGFRCLAIDAPAPEDKLATLSDIAQEYGVEWDTHRAAADMLPSGPPSGPSPPMFPQGGPGVPPGPYGGGGGGGQGGDTRFPGVAFHTALLCIIWFPEAVACPRTA